MRRLLTFQCEDATLGATLDDAAGETGVLIVTGGTQTRIGSHRLFERLASALAEQGYPCFRFDRRGVGDSEGEDPGFRGSAADTVAAASAFREACPGLRRIVGFGLCDGATALCLFGAEAGLDALTLANPWFVEAESGAPPAAAIKKHYRQQLLSVAGWRKFLGGAVSYKKLLKGITKIVAPPPATLAGEVAGSLSTRPLPVMLFLSRRDNTAVAAEDIWNSASFRQIRARNPAPVHIESDSHTLARRKDADALLAGVLSTLSS